jgi:hypothetical protein
LELPSMPPNDQRNILERHAEDAILQSPQPPETQSSYASQSRASPIERFLHAPQV